MILQRLPTVSFCTLGCRLNQSETATLESSLGEAGYKVVDFKQPADIVVINTCTVTENGDSDTARLIAKINRLLPNAAIALIGCQAQVQREKLLRFPNVRWVIGNQPKMDLAEIFKNRSSDGAPFLLTPTISSKSFIQPAANLDRIHTRANLKIQDGCDFFCSFCEIPYARGRARSREFEDILKEAKVLVRAGHQELVITGINVGTYSFEGKNITDVLSALEEIPELARIRISSIEPTTIPETLIRKMQGDTKICRHLHIPLQSGDDAVLGAMKRKYRIAEFSELLHRLTAAVPGICIGTDVIVGFPGEDEMSFRKTEQHLAELPVHYCHVFSYSQRRWARSQSLDHRIAEQAVQERSRVLRVLSTSKKRAYYESFVGTVQSVLWEQKKDGVWTGLTDHYLRVRTTDPRDFKNRFTQTFLRTAGGSFLLGEVKKLPEDL